MKASGLARLAWTVTAGAAYLWPLQQPAAPTSTFAEYRSRHFHGGLDLTTQESVGLPVRAIAPGEALRVRASGGGYGRALYLLLDDGRTVVYGHLDGFAPELAAWVDSVQEATGRYEQDLSPPPGRFRFAGGDLVGYSGESGAGPPHLHMELRRGEIALNPLAQGFSVPDGVAPTLPALWIYPASAAARVEGRAAPRRVGLGVDKDGVARPAGAVRVAGPVRVAVEGFDRTEAKPNRLGLYTLEATLDGDLAYGARFDSVSWLDAAEVEVVFDPRVRGRGRQAYALTLPPGLSCLAVERVRPAWEAVPGEHRLSLRAADVAGNVRRAEAVLEWVAPEASSARSTTAAGRRRAGEPRLEVECFADGIAVRGVGTEGPLRAGVPALGPAADSLAAERSFSLAPGFFGVVEISAAGSPDAARRFVIADVQPGWKQPLRSSDGRFSLEIEPGSLFERQPLLVETLPPRAAGAGAGAALSPTYRVEPSWLPLREAVTARLALPEGVDGDRMGLFCVASGGPRFVGGEEAGRPGVLAGRTRTLGEFFAVRDTMAPALGEARVRRGGRVPLEGARPTPFEVRWPAADRGSGIAGEESVLEVDGRRVPVEYDGENGVFRWRPRERPAAGRHAYRLQAEDRLGNRAERAGTLRVP